MNTYVNIILFEFVFVSSFFFYIQKRTAFLHYRHLLLLTLTRENTVLKNLLIPSDNFRYVNIQKRYYSVILLGLLVFIILGNITVLEFDWFLIIQRMIYNCGLLYGLYTLFQCLYFQLELGFSLKEINEEESNKKILKSVTRNKEVQSFLVTDVAYSMFFSLLIVLISCRFFVTEGIFVTFNVYELLFSKYL